MMIMIPLMSLASMTSAAQTTSQTAVVARGVGSWGDVICRDFWQEYDKIAGTNTVILNRPGAGGALAAQSLSTGESRAWCALAGELVYTAIDDKPQDFLKVAEPIGILFDSVSFMHTVKHPAIRSAEEFKQLTLKSPNPIKIGVLSDTHKSMIDYLSKKHGFRVITVRYKSGQEAVPDLTTGSLDFFFGGAGLVPMSKPWNPNGTVTAYAYIVEDESKFGLTNSAIWVNLGKGYSNLTEFVSWIGISVSKNMPQAEKEKMNKIFDQIMREGHLTRRVEATFHGSAVPVGRRITAADVERSRAKIIEIIK